MALAQIDNVSCTLKFVHITHIGKCRPLMECEERKEEEKKEEINDNDNKKV